MSETKINFPHKSPDILSEACSWIAQLETGHLSQEDMSAFQEWSGRSPAHYQEIHRLAQLSADTNVLGHLAHPMQVAINERQVAVQNKGFWANFLKPELLSCLLIVFVAIAGSVVYKYTYVMQHYVVSTGVGGFEERILSDGSIVKLNTDSQIEVDFDKSKRNIRLLRGEAYFDVAHNSRRPFVVSVDDKAVKAIGTAFSVRWTDGDLSVTVSEGRVAFAPVAKISDLEIKQESMNTEELDSGSVANIDAPVFLDAGQKLLLPQEKTLRVVEAYTPNDIRSELAWQSGILEFTKTPLSEVLHEVNRYTDLKIQISDPALRDLEFDGIFRTGETLQLFEVLEIYGLDVEYIDDKTVVVRRN